MKMYVVLQETNLLPLNVKVWFPIHITSPGHVAVIFHDALYNFIPTLSSYYLMDKVVS